MSETNELMRRPFESEELVKKRVWEIFSPKVAGYLGSDWREEDVEHIQKQVMRVLSPNKDGYAMARELERDGWAEDRELVDLMDEGEEALRSAYKEILGQWIKVYGITPERAVGDTVSTTNWRRKGQVGTITRIHEDEAKYSVHFPDQSATSSQILLYEEVVDSPEAI